MRVLITDATGGNTAASAPFSITTANAPSSCGSVESPAFAVAFDRKRRTIAYGGRLTVRGSLGGVPRRHPGLRVSAWSTAPAPRRASVARR